MIVNEASWHVCEFPGRAAQNSRGGRHAEQPSKFLKPCAAQILLHPPSEALNQVAFLDLEHGGSPLFVRLEHTGDASLMV